MVQNLKSQNSKLKSNKVDGKTHEDLVLSRLKRISGQVGGIIRMYEKEKECSDILQQIIAVRAALGGVARVLLTNEAVKCAKGEGDKNGLERSLESLIKIT